MPDRRVHALADAVRRPRLRGALREHGADATLAAIFVCVSATSLYLAQKRLDGVADAAALAWADGFTLSVVDGSPRAELSADGVREQAEALVAFSGDATLVSATTPDGVSARVTVAGVWHPPLVSMFVPEGVALEATATSRTALR